MTESPHLHSKRRVLLAGAATALALSAVAAPALAQGFAGQPVAQAGDVVTCPNDHPIAALNRPLAPRDPLPLSAFSNWRITPPATLDPAPDCPRCGRVWYEARGLGQRAGHPQIHVTGKGWLPD